MDIRYFKRYRMEIDLFGRDLRGDLSPEGYSLLSWDESLLEAFALAKYLSFRNEIDANVFPCLGDLGGCRRLMEEIVRKSGFMPQATWLAVHTSDDRQTMKYCGTIQGLRAQDGLGAIQNLGIAPEHRDLGLGTCLMYRALEGFRRAGFRRAYLEVTAQNSGAIRLYHRLGFVTVKTVYKAVEAAYSA
ncbi:MAG: GNAT family N-acetyltransferase [Thermoguttaceae bacterium]